MMSHSTITLSWDWPPLSAKFLVDKNNGGEYE
jgi:hypothetical protein